MLKGDVGIFHDPRHLKLQASSGWCSFYMLRHDQVEGIVHFHAEDSIAKSPYRSPFGSFWFSDAVPETVLADFVMYSESQLRQAGVTSVMLRNPPALYAEARSLKLQNVLNQLGYTVSLEETSAVIPVTNKLFESTLHKSEKKRLRKCRDHAFVFSIIPSDRLPEIYTFLATCREEKGYSLSMTLEELKQLVSVFPERVILTAVMNNNKIAAANISIRVYDHVLYNFYHDHASEYDGFSPVVLLNEGLYRFCQNGKIQWLDLGTSNANGMLSESLLNFKLNLGAKPSRKLTFTKILV